MEFVTILLLLPAIIWEVVSPVAASIYFLDLGLAIIVIIAGLLSFFAGRGLLNALKEITQEGKLYQLMLYVYSLLVLFSFFLRKPSL